MIEKLDAVRISKLRSDDGWAYKIAIYEDVTDIIMINEDGTEESIGQLTAQYDIQVCEEIIRLRKQKIEEG